MDPEVRELATAAVTALQTIAANSSPHWTDVAGVIVALVVGVAQCGLIAWGIRVMHNSNLTRESRHAEVMANLARHREESDRQRAETERQRKDDDRRHAEVMATLARQREEAEREAQRRHEEAQHQREETERESQRRHEEAMAALTALIERTAPQGTA